MSNRIKTNLNSLIAQRNLTRHSRALDERSAKLSSGKRITRASDDAAGLAISQYINAQVRGTRQASRNAQDAISIVQIAEGSLNELGNIVTRMRELTIQGVSDTVSTNEREMINIEIQQMKKEVGRIAEVAQWNKTKLLTGEEHSLDIQVGTHNNSFGKILIETFDLAQTPHALGIFDVRVDSQLQGRLSLAKLDFATNEISKSRAKLGAYQSRFESSINNLSMSALQQDKARSQIEDADYAKEVSANVRDKLLQKSTTSVLAQANLSGSHVKKLLG